MLGLLGVRTGRGGRPLLLRHVARSPSRLATQPGLRRCRCWDGASAPKERPSTRVAIAVRGCGHDPRLARAIPLRGAAPAPSKPAKREGAEVLWPVGASRLAEFLSEQGEELSNGRAASLLRRTLKAACRGARRTGPFWTRAAAVRYTLQQHMPAFSAEDLLKKGLGNRFSGRLVGPPAQATLLALHDQASLEQNREPLRVQKTRDNRAIFFVSRSLAAAAAAATAALSVINRSETAGDLTYLHLAIAEPQPSDVVRATQPGSLAQLVVSAGLSASSGLDFGFSSLSGSHLRQECSGDSVLGRAGWGGCYLQLTRVGSSSAKPIEAHVLPCGHARKHREVRTQESECREDATMSWAASMGDAVVADAPVAAALVGCADDFRRGFQHPLVLLQLEVGTQRQTCTCMTLLQADRAMFHPP